MARAITKKRAVTVYFLFVFFFSAIAAQIIHLQVVKGSFFRELAKNQHYRNIRLEGQRGVIFDRRKRVLATGLHCYSVFADPSLVDDPELTAKVLAKNLDVPKTMILSRLNKNKRFVWIKRKISLDQQKKIASLKLEGIRFIRERKRFYPHETVAGSVLGLTDIDNKGQEGLEIFYEKYLKGKDGQVRVLQDSSSRQLILSSQVITPQRGADIVLALDAQIQYWVEEALEKVVKDFRAKGASAIVMDAMTGEVISLANYPFFDPNERETESLEYINNRAVTDVFEPGSVFKVVALLAAVSEKTFSKDDIIFCEDGTFDIPGKPLHDWKPYGELAFEEVFMKSSNIGVAKIVAALGQETFFSYIERLGFGQLTGIDFFGESPGKLRSFSQWSRRSGYIIPIGQEISVNLIQLARAFAVIVNDGYLVKPHLAKSICSYNFCKDVNYRRKRVFSSSVAEEAKRILIKVVAEGTGKRAGIKQRVIGGKTGTAQKYDSKLGRYSPSDYRATFAGFIADLDRPIVIAVSVDEPRSSHFGGVVAAPVFREIAEKIIAYVESQGVTKSPRSDFSLN
ncbi:MAG: penicillin-binding protein 2 [Candidatus Omnitrophica bacterium]|nr:penicillin-binding protein 2 [Candidatus Omnitrophota bacterium]